jgi:uncharacterized RmlC-like cupin family protein
MSEAKRNWLEDGVRVVRHDQLDPQTAQTWGMRRFSAMTHAPSGFDSLWAGTVDIEPNARTGAHHHGPLESIICVVRGRARMRWGENLEFTATAGPGDFIFVPPWVPHQELNDSPEEALHCILVRSDREAVVINLDVTGATTPEEIVWVDAHHPR